MNISKFMKAGYACLFIETLEIKRCVKSIQVDKPFEKLDWTFITGIPPVSKEANQVDILDTVKDLQNKAIVLENFDFFIDNPTIIQNFLNNYETYKSNQVCLVIVGNSASKIPTILKELVPVIQFDLPTREEVKEVAETLSKTAEEDFKLSEGYEQNKDQFDFSVSDELISACLGLSHEEMENALALSLIENKSFNIKAILDRKRQIIKSTGFMDFMQPEPIENLGGMDKLKEYVFKRKEAFNDGSKAPKLRSILLVGIQGCGKSLASKCIASIFDWPLISLDIGSIKGGIVGQTEKNVRLATKTIDAFGRAVIQIEEIEKALSGSKSNLDSGVSAGLFGHLLTWFQERQSEGILIATANDLTQLPPEMLRAGRWDTIFFVNTPNAEEVKSIIEIQNQKYHSELPTDDGFCKTLEEEQWTGAEIEQLAKDIHFDELSVAMNNIPLLSSFRKKEMDEIREKAKQFRAASGRSESIRSKPRLKKVNPRKLNLH